MWDLKKFKLIEAVLVLILIISFVTWIGFYMIGKWSRIRDVKRQTDAAQIEKNLLSYYSQFEKLPDNEYGTSWDGVYDQKKGMNQILFKDLIKEKLMPMVFDPMNDQEHYYRYHKFEKGEYGCDKAFAIFQIMSFEGKTKNKGVGICPNKDFTKDVPNGYTLQIFE